MSGTYTGPQSKGIYAYRFDAETGKLEPVGLVGELARPSFLAIHPNRKYLYAVSELGTSTVTAFEINSQSGMLALLNKVPAKGSAACHLVVDQTGKTLVVANLSLHVSAFRTNLTFPSGVNRCPLGRRAEFRRRSRKYDAHFGS